MNIEYADVCHACGRKLVGRAWTMDDLRQSIDHAHSKIDEGRATAGRAAGVARQAASNADRVASEARDVASTARQAFETAAREARSPAAHKKDQATAEVPKKKSGCCGCFVVLAFFGFFFLVSNQEAAMRLFEFVVEQLK